MIAPMMKIKPLVLVFLIGLSGCAGSEVINRSINPLGGTVRYKNGLLVREKSRTLALAQMTEACKGPYKILSEKFNADVLSVNVGGTYVTPDKANFFFINFVCDK